MNDSMGQYLILHKVRGAPAFDIAERMVAGDESIWIIPTSGHRAYPSDWWLLDELVDVSDYPHQRPIEVAAMADLSEHPDHYNVRAEAKAKLTGLLEKLGLKKPPTNLAVRGF